VLSEFFQLTAFGYFNHYIWNKMIKK